MDEEYRKDLDRLGEIVKAIEAYALGEASLTDGEIADLEAEFERLTGEPWDSTADQDE